MQLLHGWLAAGSAAGCVWLLATAVENRLLRYRYSISCLLRQASRSHYAKERDRRARAALCGARRAAALRTERRPICRGEAPEEDWSLAGGGKKRKRARQRAPSVERPSLLKREAAPWAGCAAGCAALGLRSWLCSWLGSCLCGWLNCVDRRGPGTQLGWRMRSANAGKNRELARFKRGTPSGFEKIVSTHPRLSSEGLLCGRSLEEFQPSNGEGAPLPSTCWCDAREDGMGGLEDLQWNTKWWR